MRAISLHQPWATAIALGSKRIETRHWSTDYRGPLVIHAAKRCNIGELIHYQSCWNWNGALRALDIWNDKVYLHKVLPFGALVAVCNLIDCRPTESFTIGEIETPRKPEGEKSDLYNWTERQMGNFEPGRFGWVLSDIKPLATPVPFLGNRNFFSVPAELLG